MRSDTSIELVHRAIVASIARGDSAEMIATELVEYSAVQRIFRGEYSKCLRDLGLPRTDTAEGVSISYQYLRRHVHWETYQDFGAQSFGGFLARLSRSACLRVLSKTVKQRRAERELIKAALRGSKKPANPHAQIQCLDELLLCASTAPNRLRQFMTLMAMTGSVEVTTRLLKPSKKTGKPLSEATVKRYQRAAWKHFQQWRRRREHDDLDNDVNPPS